MAEVLFYHLTSAPLEASLPQMCERALARGWRAILRAGTEAELARLDDLLWTWRADAFLPHGTKAMGHAEHQPIYLTCGPENPNGASLLLLVDGAPATEGEMATFARTCRLFDGNDAQALIAARAEWRAVRAAGLPAKYWAQEAGRWVQKAAG